MNRIARLIAAAGVAGTLFALAPAARAQEGEPLIIGTTRVLQIRTGDTLNKREWSVRDRIDHVHDVFAKYLGGPYYKITSKTWGDRVHLYLNGEFVLAVTPADAEATGYKSAAQLAPVWAKGLARGFEQAHVRSAAK